MTTSFAVYPRRDENDYTANAVQLTAKTDLGARRQAKKIALENGWKVYYISFFRTSDCCTGSIDI